MKKLVASFMFIVVVLMATIPTYAASSKIIVDGTTINSDVAPETKNNRTMVPLRVIGENLGITVDWSNSVVTLTKNKMKVTLTTKSNKAVIDGKEVKLDTKPYLKNNRVFVPLRFISETFNSEIDYKNHTVTINTTPFYVNGVKIKAVQEEYHMTMGGVEQQVNGNAYIEAIYNLIVDNKGKQVEAPANYSWESHPNSGTYNKLRQYNFLDANGISVQQFDIYSLVDSYNKDFKDMPQLLLYDANIDQWYWINEVTFELLWLLIDTATKNGFHKIISNTVA